MKKLAILTLLASPAFADQVPFNDPEFLKLSEGDAVGAHQLAVYCSTRNNCAQELSGNGNLKVEAARKCVQSLNRLQIIYKFPDGNEVPGSRVDQLFGTIWHEGYHKDENGNDHRHVFTEQDRQAARQEAEARQRAIEIDRAVGEKGTKTETTGKEIGGDLQVGTGGISPVNVQVGVNAKGNDSTTIASPLLDDAAKKRIKAAGEAAYKNPSAYSTQKPSIGCMRHEINCVTGDGSIYKNESYEPKKDEKSGDKKGADNPPEHVDETPIDIPFEKITHPEGEKMAGGSTQDVSGIATPLEIDFDRLSPMEKCVQKETKRLNDEFGKKTINDDGTGEESDKEKNAKALLRHGYCDEEVLGKEYCQEFKFQQDSVVAVDIKQDRKAAAQAALGKLINRGTCDDQALGHDFCKKHAEKWLKTPVGIDPGNQMQDKNPLLRGDKGTSAPRIIP